MQERVPDLDFFIAVEGTTFSSHRSPKGVYKVRVPKTECSVTNASVALQVAQDHIPFMDENAHSVTLRVFSSAGCEVHLPRRLYTDDVFPGRYLGRSDDHPESILQ
jgi:hypothetical protein